MVCRRKEKKKVHRLLVCREEGADAQHCGQAARMGLLCSCWRDRAEAVRDTGHGRNADT